jgi:hypothetical protein
MFLDSPGHRANVVGRDWDVVGVGAFKGPDGRKVWTVLFADACDRARGALAAAEPAPTAAPEPTADRAVEVPPRSPLAGSGGLHLLGAVLLDLLRTVLALGAMGIAAR